jgi:hypothetical protein
MLLGYYFHLRGVIARNGDEVKGTRHFCRWFMAQALKR